MKKILIALLGLVALGVLLSFSRTKEATKHHTTYKSIPRGCVFRTIMGEERSDSSFRYKTPERVNTAINQGLAWVARAQNANGGWGAGSHHRQDVMDPHAVQPDPATTSMVAMAILRSGSTLHTGPYSKQLSAALTYLLTTIEMTPPDNLNITHLQGTQIQTKLGANIDVILTAQFLSNLLPYLEDQPQLHARVKQNLNTCVTKIQQAQDPNGSTSGSGWAGVLQSSFASNALEAAQAQGAAVDAEGLERSRAFQKNNYNAKTGDVNTALGAGIMLYSVTGSARASAKEARKVEEEISKAKQDGRLAPNAPATAENLSKIGFAEDEAIKYSTAYEVYQSAKVQAQKEDVMQGFGNNGGEEFLSYLQTGEGLIISKDTTWKNWYDNISGRMLSIQNDDGSWSGHHCITSPVFCTATCLLILSINKDVDALMELGKN